MRKFGSLIGALFIFGVAAPVLAHHGFDTEYDANKHVKLEGVVTMVSWTNPHMRVYIDVKDKDGKVTNWNMELPSPNTIRRQGWGPDDLAGHGIGFGLFDMPRLAVTVGEIVEEDRARMKRALVATPARRTSQAVA